MGAEGDWLKLVSTLLVAMLSVGAKSCIYEFHSSVEKNGSFASPNYPELYPAGTQCLYVFNGYQWEGIRIEFLSFNLQPPYTAG